MSRCNSTKKGFSLAELLVVIVLVSILAAILYPVIFKAKHSAYGVVNISNLRQLGQAAAIYSGNEFRYLPSNHHVLVDSGIFPAKLSGAEGDYLPEGLANHVRQTFRLMGTTTQLNPVEYKDSIFCYDDWYGRPVSQKFIESSGTGWAIVFNKITFAKTWGMSDRIMFPSGRYSRLRFDGGVVSRETAFPVKKDKNGRRVLPFHNWFDDSYESPR